MFKYYLPLDKLDNSVYIQFGCECMRPSELLLQYKEDIKVIFVKYPHIKSPHIFGSVCDGSDEEGSDIDFLVYPDRGVTYFDIAELQSDLENLLQCRVDITTPRGLPNQWRDKIIHHAVLL
ncbi:nucleotidyltransferase family protein [Pelistega ratti]|uniref:nucleotidyltransferase family protein n=1 Tax=Pelistega ratti TaxID=2652177 RepID=UPI00135CC0BA|nr:nucleotidyltransferase domain-containing protein [Pelistega ratti]